MAGVWDHPEIDDWLEKADEVLEACPGPTTSDPSTGTPSSPPDPRSDGGGRPGQKKSKSHIARAAA